MSNDDPRQSRIPDAMAGAIAAIDDANAGDPNRFEGRPLALVQGERADHWVAALAPDAGEAVRLAARAHHLRRWTVPRDSYPPGRAGYLRWRRDQKTRHARELIELLSATGVDDDVCERAAVIVTKQGLGTDPEVQLFEDAVALTFVETQLDTTVEKLDDDDKMVDVVAKTLRKMSPAAHAAAATISLGERAGAILEGAVARARE